MKHLALAILLSTALSGCEKKETTPAGENEGQVFIGEEGTVVTKSPTNLGVFTFDAKLQKKGMVLCCSVTCEKWKISCYSSDCMVGCRDFCSCDNSLVNQTAPAPE